MKRILLFVFLLFPLLGCDINIKSDDLGNRFDSGDGFTLLSGVKKGEKVEVKIDEDGAKLKYEEIALIIPENVVEEEVEIGIRIAKAPVPLLDKYDQVSSIYEFTPYDMVFEKPITLDIEYNDDKDGQYYVLTLRDDEDETWQIVESVQFEGGVASIKVTRFGYYVVVCQEDDVEYEQPYDETQEPDYESENEYDEYTQYRDSGIQDEDEDIVWAFDAGSPTSDGGSIRINDAAESEEDCNDNLIELIEVTYEEDTFGDDSCDIESISIEKDVSWCRKYNSGSDQGISFGGVLDIDLSDIDCDVRAVDFEVIENCVSDMWIVPRSLEGEELERNLYSAEGRFAIQAYETVGSISYSTCEGILIAIHLYGADHSFVED